MEKSWSFSNVWNQSIEQGKPDRKFEPREKIWASEIGGSLIDRFLKMKGVEPTNPPNARSLRKFEAGNIWESILGFVLLRAGVLIESQEWVQYQYHGLFPVSGRLDFIAGGNPDYEKAISAVQEDFAWLPKFISKAVVEIVNNLKNQFPDGLSKIVLEIKSCSSFMFEIYEKKETASPQHKCQIFHYLKSKNMPEGHIVYVSRDDARLLEVGVFNPSSTEEIYKKDIEDITGFVKSNTRPPLEKPIVFDEQFGKFSANWKVGYSQYLTLLYELKTQAEFDEKYKPIAERWNRVLGRIEGKKELTDNNKLAIEEMKKEGFDIEKIKGETT